MYITNVLMCRPPGNRDPQPDEIEACESHLFRKLELIQPKLVATLGNFATKLLSGKPTGITRVHGRPQEALVGGRRVTLYPIYHPAAALYTPAMLKTLEEDFSRIPELLSGAPGVVPPAEAQVIQFPTARPARPRRFRQTSSSDCSRGLAETQLRRRAALLAPMRRWWQRWCEASESSSLEAGLAARRSSGPRPQSAPARARDQERDLRLPAPDRLGAASSPARPVRALLTDWKV